MQVVYDGNDVRQCVKFCEADFNCHGIVALKSQKTCYFRGGPGQLPEALMGDRRASADNDLFVIFGKHNAPPAPPPPNPPPAPPYAYACSFAGVLLGLILLTFFGLFGNLLCVMGGCGGPGRKEAPPVALV